MLNGFTQMNVILCLVVADTRLTPKAHTKISCFFCFFTVNLHHKTNV